MINYLILGVCIIVVIAAFGLIVIIVTQRRCPCCNSTDISPYFCRQNSSKLFKDLAKVQTGGRNDSPIMIVFVCGQCGTEVNRLDFAEYTAAQAQAFLSNLNNSP